MILRKRGNKLRDLETEEVSAVVPIIMYSSSYYNIDDSYLCAMKEEELSDLHLVIYQQQVRLKVR